jgi:hypothetical protein
MNTPRPILLAALGIALLATPVARLANASMTAPTLAIGRVEAEAGDGGALVTVDGAFPFDDVAGRDYAMQLFVRAVDEGARFICFSTLWGPMVGSDPRFEKGLDAKNIDEVKPCGSSPDHHGHGEQHQHGGDHLATPSDRAHFVRVEPGQLQVQLEPDFPEGLAEAQLFVMYNGVPVFSNPVSFQVGGDTE